MKTLNLFLILLLMCGGIAMAQVIPYGPKTKSTTTNKAYPQPMQVTPKAETSLESNGMAQGFSNTSNTVSITGNSNLTVTLTANAQNLPNNLGGQFTETELGRISSNGGDPNWKCDNVAMHYSATSDNFLNSQYSAISSPIFPGAIYKAIDFLTGNRNEITVNRNPIQIGVDNIWHTTGATYRNVAEPSQTMVNNAMSSIASSTTGSLRI
ncbi:MAG: hypothetical protein IPJ20_02945 [Flammeovirgaceae bacterium]|nr:hypothetical protein [Flammeovirgaceae bacterium]